MNEEISDQFPITKRFSALSDQNGEQKSNTKWYI